MNIGSVEILGKRLLAAGFAFGLFLTGAQAASLDLTGSINDSGWLGGAYFANTEPVGSQGTGVLDPFLRLQGKKNNPGDEQGYNTDGALEFDTKGGTHTHSVLFSSIVPYACSDFFTGDCTGNTNDYYLFILDFNETASSPLINLTEIEIYAMANGNETGYNPLNSPWDNRLFDLDAGEDNTVNLNYLVSGSGSGSGDLFVYIPLSGIPAGSYMTFFSAFGLAVDAETGKDDFDAGFEEWAFQSCVEGCGGGGGGSVPDIPEPSTMLLMGGSLLGLAWWRNRRS